MSTTGIHLLDPLSPRAAGRVSHRDAPPPSTTRLLAIGDAPALRQLLCRNRRFLETWQPARPEYPYSEQGQREAVEMALRSHRAGGCVPLVILGRDSEIVGRVTLQSILRGPVQSCSVGYWLSEDAQGHGWATAALRQAVDVAFQTLNLHRVQAETVATNSRSLRVLERIGFTHYGTATACSRIAGRWQDHRLYELITPNSELVVVD